jgi:ribosomal protein S18 acetylase RimI-like enzyme
MTAATNSAEKHTLSKVLFRSLREEDLPQLEWDGEYTHYRQVYANAYRRSLNGLTLIWVAQIPENKIIGQVFVQLNSDRPELADGSSRAYLYAFRIRPEYRNLGLGSIFLTIVEEDIQNRGFTYLTLNVAKKNEDALRLYRRKGYKVVAHEPGRWSYTDHQGVMRHVIEPAWRMEKRLTPFQNSKATLSGS